MVTRPGGPSIVAGIIISGIAFICFFPNDRNYCNFNHNWFGISSWFS